MNNADFGLTFQKIICEEYDIIPDDWAKSQFVANYNSVYRDDIIKVVNKLFKEIKAKPIELLTYSKKLTNSKQTTSPHNFLLSNNKTLSIRTTKTSSKVAPRTVGQAGYTVLNDYFSEIYKNKIRTQYDIRNLIFYHIHEILPIFIDNLFQSDYTAIISLDNIANIEIIESNSLPELSFVRSDFTFTRGLDTWIESTTLKYKGISIAEIQTHKERTFKFRFILSTLPRWLNLVKETTETIGMSAEAAICDYFDLEKPISFSRRTKKEYINLLLPVVDSAFKFLPRAIKHSGSDKGERGKTSKCSYDFILEGNRHLSVKTNKERICPPEVGQPGSETCLYYFKDFFDKGTIKVTRENFKKMVYSNIDKLIPIYINHLFDSDWLLWISNADGDFKYKIISQADIKNKIWNKDGFTFTKKNISEWNESNTVKYNGISIGEFQVHQNRNCFKFRFIMKNLLKFIS